MHVPVLHGCGVRLPCQVESESLRCHGGSFAVCDGERDALSTWWGVVMLGERRIVGQCLCSNAAGPRTAADCCIPVWSSRQLHCSL